MLTSLLLAGLAFAQEAPEADPAWSQIVNGKTEKGFQSAVGIGFMAGDIRYQSCSASLIAPRILLTAGHCTAEFVAQSGLSEDQLVEFGAAFFGPTVATAKEIVGFESVHVHPKYMNSGVEIRNDIQVIVLDADANQPATWFQSEPLDRDLAVGQDVVSVGYGITSSGADNSSGVKRSATLVVSDIDDQFLYSFASGNVNKANVCSGDSGGPQYHRDENGNYLQWAIHSFVFSMSGNQPDPCLVASGSTRTDAFADFIFKQVEDVYGTTDRCEINSNYGDRVCDADCANPDPDCQLDVDANGLVDDAEFDKADRNGDGELSDKEIVRATTGGCNQTGTLPVGLAGLALGALALRRRRA